MFSLTQWMKVESNRCLITVLTQGSRRMANGLAPTSGDLVLHWLNWRNLDLWRSSKRKCVECENCLKTVIWQIFQVFPEVACGDCSSSKYYREYLPHTQRMVFQGRRKHKFFAAIFLDIEQTWNTFLYPVQNDTANKCSFKSLLL